MLIVSVKAMNESRHSSLQRKVGKQMKDLMLFDQKGRLSDQK